MMGEIVELYILITVIMTMTFIFGHSFMKEQKILHSFLANCLVCFYGREMCCNCWFVEVHSRFVSQD